MYLADIEPNREIILVRYNEVQCIFVKHFQKSIFPTRQLLKSVLAAALGPLSHPSRSARL